MITQLELGIKDGVSVSLVSINIYRLAGDTLDITCNFLYCNHQVHRNILITLYMQFDIYYTHKLFANLRISMHIQDMHHH
jgi:hypothetical protein